MRYEFIRIKLRKLKCQAVRGTRSSIQNITFRLICPKSIFHFQHVPFIFVRRTILFCSSFLIYRDISYKKYTANIQGCVRHSNIRVLHSAGPSRPRKNEADEKKKAEKEICTRKLEVLKLANLPANVSSL